MGVLLLTTVRGGLKCLFVSKKTINSFTRSCFFSTVSTSRLTMASAGHGVVLGAYVNSDFAIVRLTKAAEKFDESVNGALTSHITKSSVFSQRVKVRVFHDLTDQAICLTSVDVSSAEKFYDAVEDLNVKKETIRAAVANGVKALAQQDVYHITVDTFDDAESAAEGACLISFIYDELKKKSSRRAAITLEPVDRDRYDAWRRGLLKAEFQNFSRYLMETPANLMTPTKFVEIVKQKLENTSVEVFIKEESWVKEQKMEAFLCVAKGSVEPLKFLELHYLKGSPDQKPIVLVGKGITFDSGGISIKPSAGMESMKADMGGGACVASTIYGVATMEVPINVIGLIPLCENMPDGKAVKPGDVICAKNGITIEVVNTDAEGRLILADALVYAQSFKPSVIIDIATLTGAMDVALGGGCCGVFSNTPDIYAVLHKAGVETGDRVWHMPLFKMYKKQLTESVTADLTNIGSSRSAGACTAAAFLKEFVGDFKWMHIDIAGVMSNKDHVPYLSKGMAGRPTRTMVEFLLRMANAHQKGDF